MAKAIQEANLFDIYPFYFQGDIRTYNNPHVFRVSIPPYKVYQVPHLDGVSNG